MNTLNEISIITTHFYDFHWIELWIKQIRQYTNPNLIKEILVINQDRNEESRKRLQKLDDDIRVLEYPISKRHFEVTGHDHAAVLNAAILEARSEWIIIFDSDSFPTTSIWVDKCNAILQTYDAIVAQVPDIPTLSHPCFMVLNQDSAHIPLKFDELLFSDKFYDTGRLVGQQIIRSGKNVYFAPPKKAFNGYWGSIYLDSIYHHSSGSFLGGDERLTKQITWQSLYFRKAIFLKNKYSLSNFQLLKFRFFSLCKRLIK
jgi:hypothetical protein